MGLMFKYSNQNHQLQIVLTYFQGAPASDKKLLFCLLQKTLWCNGPFPSGKYLDIKIFRSKLKKLLIVTRTLFPTMDIAALNAFRTVYRRKSGVNGRQPIQKYERIWKVAGANSRLRVCWWQVGRRKRVENSWLYSLLRSGAKDALSTRVNGS